MNIIATIQNDGYTFNFYTDYTCHETTKDDEKRKQIYLGITTDSCSCDFINCHRCPLYYQCKDTPVAVVLARFNPDVLSTHPEFYL